MLKAIIAVDQLGGIGLNGTLPWPHNSEDMKWFQSNTTGHIVVMGRKTWEHPKMPKPLPDRINLVVTNQPILTPGITAMKGDIIERLKTIQKQYPSKDIFIIGGKILLESCISHCDQIYLTMFKGAYKVDTAIDLPKLLHGFQLRTVKPGLTCMFSIYHNELKSRNN